MANDGSQGSGNGVLYGLIGALCVVVAGGGFYIYQSNQPKPAPEAAQAAPVAAPTPPAPPPPVQAAPRPAPAPAGPSASQLAQARASIADARRLATRGNFGDAEAALQNADAIVPGFAETATARREIADMRTARGQTGRHDNQLTSLVAAARAAIARHDYSAADRALDEAEKIDARNPAVVQARSELLEAAARPARPPNRN